MKKLLLPVFVASAVAACGHRAPTDAQLNALLRADNGMPRQAPTRIDGFAVNCLRAWSGDTELMTGLVPGVTTNDGKNSCRRRIDNWIADATRNPDKLVFDDLTPVPVVRRIVALQKTGNASAAAPLTDRTPPPALQRATTAPPGAPSTPVDLGATGQHLVAAESACQRLQAAADGGNSDINIQRYSKMCAPNLKTLRAKMEQVARTNPERLPAYARSADDIADAAQRFLAKAGVK